MGLFFHEWPRFVETESFGRLYATGDLGRWTQVWAQVLFWYPELTAYLAVHGLM